MSGNLKKMRKYINSKNILNYLPELIIILVYSYILFSKVVVNYGDDVNYYLTVFDQMSVWEYIVSRYQGWSSRLIIDLLVAVLIHALPIWKCATVLLAISIYHNLVRLCDAAEGTQLILCRFSALFLLLLYPFCNDMQSAGWVATSVNYFWVLAALLSAVNSLKKYTDTHHLTGPEWAGFIVSFIFCTDQEQSSIIFLMISAALFVKRSYTEKKPDYPMLILIALNAAIVVFELTCPGNAARSMANIDYWMPSFSGFTLPDKSYMGVYAIYAYFICGVETIHKPLLMLIILIVIFAELIMSGGRSRINRILTLTDGIAILFEAGFVAVRVLGDLNIPILHKILYNPGQIDRVDWNAKRTFLPLIITALIFGSFAGYIISSSKRSVIFSLMLLVSGLASESIMGFSPTIWASCERTAIFSYFLWGCAIMMTIFEKENKDNPVRDEEKQPVR